MRKNPHDFPHGTSLEKSIGKNSAYVRKSQTEVCQCDICREPDKHYDLACLCRGGCGSLVEFPLSWKLDTTATNAEIERLAWCSRCADFLKTL